MDPNATNFSEAPATGKIVTHPQLPHYPQTLAFEAVGLSSSGTKSSRWMETLMNRYLFLALIAFGFLIPASAQTNVFSCSSFASTGACSASQTQSTNFVIRNGGNLSGSIIDFVPANSGHNGYGMAYHTPVNVQAFTTTFTFVPNGQNIAFVAQNTSDQSGYQGNIFAAGAGCEAGFYQGSVDLPYWYTPNFLFALELSSEDRRQR